MHTPLQRPVTSKYLPAIDGLRAVSVIPVISGHGTVPGFNGGSVGVDIFFVISGFLITKILHAELAARDRIDLVQFYARRFVRLFPALFLLCIAVSAWLYFTNGMGAVLRNIVPAMTYVSDYTRSRFNQPDMLAHLWSLAVEEQFYVFYPLLLAVIFRCRNLVNPIHCLLVLLFIVIGWRAWLFMHDLNVVRIYDGIDTHADGLIIGCILALLPATTLTRLARLAPISAAALIGWVAFGSWDSPILYLGGFTVFSLCSASLVAATATADDLVISRVLEARWLVLLGRLSYGIYLWHFPLISIFMTIAKVPPQVSVLYAAPASVLLAAVSYYGIENRLMVARVSFSGPLKTALAVAGPGLLAIGFAYCIALKFGFLV